MSELISSQQPMPSSQSTAPAEAPAKIVRKKRTTATKPKVASSETQKKAKKTAATPTTGHSKKDKSPMNHPQYVQMASQAIQVGLANLPKFKPYLDIRMS